MNVLVVLSLISFLGYMLTNRRPYKFMFKTYIDDKIKPIPLFVIPYIALVPFILYGYSTLEGDLLNKFALSILIANSIATIFWYTVPNGVKRERIQDNDIFSNLINCIYQFDKDTNGFPSGHVFLSAICTYFLLLNSLNPFIAVIGILIALPAIFTKQHYIVDIAGGLLFASISIVTGLSLS